MSEKFLMKGNEALAEAAIRAGCRHFFGYPITPQTEISAYMAKQMPKIGGTYLQAESEISAINMVLGASSAGVRAMTSSSSPGISLKSECVSYIAGSDLPCVIIDVMRGGPGLGGIQPSQADYWQVTKALGHGDFQLLVYAPASVQEMVNLVYKAFDKSDEYTMPAIILADGMLGQMMEPVSFPESNQANIKEKLWATNGTKGKRKPNITNSLLLNPDELEKSIIERYKKYEIIKQKEVLFEEYLTDDADILLVSYGATSRISKSAVNEARNQGIKVGLLRPMTLWPFPSDRLSQLSKKVQKMLVVEMSMGQMVDDVKLSTNGACPVEFYGRTGGVIPTPKEILHKILEISQKEGE